MDEFNSYLQDLASHESFKTNTTLDSRQKILVNAGVQLNWMGDFLANPKIEYQRLEVPLNKIQFTATEPEWNEILMIKCDASIQKFQDLILADETLKEKFNQEASFGEEPILLVGPNNQGFYRPFDGMHRLVGAAINRKETISAYVQIKENDHLPICEAHVIYDLIRGFQRNAKDNQGKIELYHALKLLARTYENVISLLKNRFGPERIHDEDVQEVLKSVIAES